MSDSIVDAIADSISAAQRVAKLEVEVARLTAELDEVRGADPAVSVSRFLTLAARTIDQAIVDVQGEAQSAVDQACSELEQRRAHAERAVTEARAEAEAAQQAAAQVTIGARRELEKARDEAAAVSTEAEAVAEETRRRAEAEANQIVAVARTEASKALVTERQRFAREVEALSSVREALIQERRALENYHSQLQARVRDLAQAMVDFMADKSEKLSLESLANLTTRELEPRPVEDHIPPVPTVEAIEPEPDVAEVVETAELDSEIGTEAHHEFDSEIETEAHDEFDSEIETEAHDEFDSQIETEAHHGFDSEIETEAHHGFDAEIETEGWADPEHDVDAPAGAAAPASGDGSPDDDSRPEDLFSKSFLPVPQADLEPFAGSDLEPPEAVRPVVEVLPAYSEPQPPTFHVVPDPVHDAPVEPSTGAGTSNAEDPWREVDPNERPLPPRALFGGPVEPSVLAAVRDSEALFSPAHPDEGPVAERSSLGRMFLGSGGTGLPSAALPGEERHSFDRDDSIEDAQFQDFIDGDDDDDSRRWLLHPDES